jgi:hypothetical protein
MIFAGFTESASDPAMEALSCKPGVEFGFRRHPPERRNFHEIHDADIPEGV